MIHKTLNRLLIDNNMSGYQFSKLSGIPEPQVYRYPPGRCNPASEDSQGDR